MLGIGLLNEIVGAREIFQADEILNTLRSEIKKSLHQQGRSLEQQDGMDLALVVIDKQNNSLSFSGANNPLYLFTKNVSNLDLHSKKVRSINKENKYLVEFKPDKVPIGIYTHEKNFTCNEIKFTKGDIIYLSTDGYIDQFGGENRQKFMSKKFKQLIFENADKPMIEQKNILSETLKNWQAENEQLDDILVMGIKLIDNL